MLFDSVEDMMKKADYYLCHDSEREKIARAGWEKVQQQFSYEKQLERIFCILQENVNQS